MSVVSLFKDTDMAVVTSHKNRGLRVLQLLEISVHVSTLFPRFFFLVLSFFFLFVYFYFFFRAKFVWLGASISQMVRGSFVAYIVPINLLFTRLYDFCDSFVIG